MLSAPQKKILFLLRKVDCNDGIASYCRTLATGLRNVDVSTVMVSGQVNACPSEEAKKARLQSALQAWHVFPALRKIPSPWLIITIVRLIRDSKIDVINIHGLGMLIWGKCLSLMLNRPVAATYHPSASGNTVATNDERRLTFFERLVLSWCAPRILIVLSTDSKQFLANNCPSVANKVRIAPGGGDDIYFRLPTDEERAEARASLGLSAHDLCVLNVSRLAQVKRQKIIIDAARLLRKKNGQSQRKYFFVGSGPDETSLKDYAYKEPSDSISFYFPGFIGEQIIKFYWAADIFVLPSLVEGFPLAVIEAMLCGLPVIRTPCGGASEQVIPGVTGLLIPYDDPVALCQAIEALCDASFRLQLGENAYNHAKANFTQRAFCDRINALYNEMATV